MTKLKIKRFLSFKNRQVSIEILYSNDYRPQPIKLKSIRMLETRRERNLIGQNICSKLFSAFTCWCQWLYWSTCWLPWCLIRIRGFRYLNFCFTKISLCEESSCRETAFSAFDSSRHNLTLSGSLVSRSWLGTCTGQRQLLHHWTLLRLGSFGLLNFVE